MAAVPSSPSLPFNARPARPPPFTRLPKNDRGARPKGSRRPFSPRGARCLHNCVSRVPRAFLPSCRRCPTQGRCCPDAWNSTRRGQGARPSLSPSCRSRRTRPRRASARRRPLRPLRLRPLLLLHVPSTFSPACAEAVATSATDGRRPQQQQHGLVGPTTTTSSAASASSSSSSPPLRPWRAEGPPCMGARIAAGRTSSIYMPACSMVQVVCIDTCGVSTDDVTKGMRSIRAPQAWRARPRP